MLNKNLTLMFFIIILIEGFFTLSLELLVIRQVVPFVGNGTEMVSIIISSVLLPLSIGYYYGGKRYSTLFKKNNKTKIRNILTKNIYIIVTLSGIGFSYILMHFYFKNFPINNLMIALSVYLIFFLVFPTFLLGQTVPLISNYFSSKEMSKITGKILFISTAGSFAGSIITVLILMRFIGVSNTLLFIEALLLILVILISKEKIKSIFLTLFIFTIIFVLKSISIQGFNIEYENKYNTVMIKTKGKRTILSINNSGSSSTENNNTHFYKYINVINNILKNEKDKNILVIGAGGFTAGFNDLKNKYTYIDIDPDLKKISEEKFLKEKIKKNKKFIPTEIRAFLKNDKNKYDVIIVDAYSNIVSIPMSLVTREFYSELKDSLTENGYIISNIISDPYLISDFSRNMDNTFRTVFNTVVYFPLINIEKDKLESISKLKNKEKLKLTNNIYILRDINKSKKIYTDDKNSASFDTLNRK